MKDKLLIIEDDSVIADLEKSYLTANGYEVDVFYDGYSGLQAALNNDYSLIVLDVMLPGIDGYAICRKIRAEKKTPILFVTAKQGNDDVLNGFDMGADDYITKPFNFKEFLARVKVHVNRYNESIGNSEITELCFRNLKLQKESRRVYLDGKEVQMTNKEFDLLWFLSLNPDRVFSKDELFYKIWGYDSIGETSTVTVHINRIREKIDCNSSGHHFIETVWGAGYRFVY